ncbi:hypothetical protein BC936DRAFT_147243 [Jimgerdemannia flammicorona]|uniref:Uncharacterized protein n=1 Tax=Jimgerdemannia flammicorona TaxID=994334 RepID=A0A433D5T5_9FUNG|nr:hypothetical protein BC936DRAFT_147243 [Jimgerdemannia flammicorona]
MNPTQQEAPTQNCGKTLVAPDPFNIKDYQHMLFNRAYTYPECGSSKQMYGFSSPASVPGLVQEPERRDKVQNLYIDDEYASGKDITDRLLHLREFATPCQSPIDFNAEIQGQEVKSDPAVEALKERLHLTL